MRRLELPGVERPRTAPELGAKTAQVVLDLIRLHPEHHDQMDWITWPDGETSCNTTLCVAGWTQWVHEGWVDWELAAARAAHYLGLGQVEAHALFHTMNEERALRALEYVARGEEIDWHEVTFGRAP